MTVEETVVYLEGNPEVKKGLLEGTLSLLNISQKDLIRVISMLQENNKLSVSKFWY